MKIKKPIFALMLGLLFVLAGCSNQIAQERENYFNWAIRQHRQFEQEKGNALPPMQYYSCGGQSRPCKKLSTIHETKRLNKGTHKKHEKS